MSRYKYFIYTILVSVLAISCIHYTDEQSIALSDAVTDITVSEARGFYENDIMSRADTECKSPNVLSPGDYTPQWNNAEMSQNSRIACVDVPIIPTYRYRAIRSEFSRGHAKAYKVDVSQKLIIVKDRESGVMASYIMSLIPDKGFAAKHKGDISNIFLNANDRGRYSGAIFYTHYGIPVNYVHYTDGDEDCNISVLGDIDRTAKVENYRNIMKKFIGIKFKKTSNILSRNGEYDSEEEEDPYEFPELYYIGSGYYIDNDGNSYFDADEDGVPEREFNLKEDPHEFEESNHENNDTNPDEGDGGGGPENEIPNGFYMAIGRNGFDKMRMDLLVNKHLRFKKLKLWQGEYILEDFGINDVSKEAIHKRYGSVYSEYRDSNAYTFGEDVYFLLRENNNYNPYWIKDRTQAIVVCFDERLPLDDLKNGTVFYRLRETAAIVRDTIEIKNIEGVSKFTVGLMKKQ